MLWNKILTDVVVCLVLDLTSCLEFDQTNKVDGPIGVVIGALIVVNQDIPGLPSALHPFLLLLHTPYLTATSASWGPLLITESNFFPR